MTKVYFAAPLHNEEDRIRNKALVERLRHEGFKVYLPQEHGVWEKYLKVFNGDEEKTRKHFYILDIKAMQEADICIAVPGDISAPRGPSEGMLWEMGWMAGNNKPVFLYNDGGYWKFNLMPQFGSLMFEDFDVLIQFLKEEDFR